MLYIMELGRYTSASASDYLENKEVFGKKSIIKKHVK